MSGLARTVLLAAWSGFLIASAGPALAADPAGPAGSGGSGGSGEKPPAALKVTVLSVSGQAQKLRADKAKAPKWQPLTKGDVLDELTIIRTGLRSKVVLKFDDRGVVTVSGATKVGISQFRKRGRQVNARLGVKYGMIRARVDSTRGPNDFRVSTPVATLSVRGSGGVMAVLMDSPSSATKFKSNKGNWLVRTNPKWLNIGPGQDTNGRLDWPVMLAFLRMSPWLLDMFHGLTDEERKFLELYRSGRGIIVATSHGRRRSLFRILRRLMRLNHKDYNGNGIHNGDYGRGRGRGGKPPTGKPKGPDG